MWVPSQGLKEILAMGLPAGLVDLMWLTSLCLSQNQRKSCQEGSAPWAMRYLPSGLKSKWRKRSTGISKSVGRWRTLYFVGGGVEKVNNYNIVVNLIINQKISVDGIYHPFFF